MKNGSNIRKRNYFRENINTVNLAAKRLLILGNKSCKRLVRIPKLIAVYFKHAASLAVKRLPDKDLVK